MRTLHERGTSAYHARLFAAEERVTLVTETGFVTFRPDGSDEEHGVAIGPLSALQGDALVFWRSGHLSEVALDARPERDLVAVPHPPQYILGAEGRVAWIRTQMGSGTSLQTLAGGQARSIHESAGAVSAPVMNETDVYWVAQGADSSWRIERVALDGRPPASGAFHRGRPPSMLAVNRGGVYFYAGPDAGVRRLALNLERETSVARGLVCSPLAVSDDRVVCAQVGGLVEIALSDATPRFLASERSGPITALAVTSSRAYWVAENGSDRSVVRSVGLTER